MEQQAGPQLWFTPGPNFGYTIIQIDDHPWNTLLTMKEIDRLEPASISFQGPGADHHLQYWQPLKPHYFHTHKLSPHFILSTSPVHPHSVETAPRKPFLPWKD